MDTLKIDETNGFFIKKKIVFVNMGKLMSFYFSFLIRKCIKN